MSGTGNSFTAIQRGLDHVIRGRNGGPLVLAGTGNSLTITQIGSRLTYVDHFDFAADGLSGSVLQEGTDLTMIQSGRWPIGFAVEQTGTGFGIRIDHGQALTVRPLAP